MPLNYKDKEVERIVQQMYSTGFTQEGVNEVYKRLGLGTPPVVPAELIGKRPGSGRASASLLDQSGRVVGGRTGTVGEFLNQFGKTAMDPYREMTGLQRVTGGVLNAVGTAVGGPVWTAMTTAANAGNKALGNTSSSSDFGEYGAIGGVLGAGYNALGGAGSYNASNAPSGGVPNGAIDESGAIGRNVLGNSGGNMASGSGWDWGTILEYGLPILGGVLESQGAKDAARASSQASQAAIDENRRQYDTTRQDLMPWMDAGRNALTRLQTPETSFVASPDYAFRRSEGTRGIEGSFAARGGAASGNALRALNEFNSNMASGEFGNWWNRQAGLAGVGQAATTNVANYGANSAANVGNLLQSQGNARASGIEGSTNAGTNTLANLLAIWQRRNGRTLEA